MLRIPRRFSLSNPDIIVSVVDLKEDIILLYKLIVFNINGSSPYREPSMR